MTATPAGPVMTATTPAMGTAAPATPGTPGTTVAPMTPGGPSATPAMPAGNPGAAMDPPVQLPVETGTPTLFWLDITGNTVYTAPASGGMQKRFASGSPLSAPDGVAVDTVMGFVYVLNMGSVLGGANSGSLVRYKLDGTGGETIMPAGSKADGQTFNTGKQVSMDKVNRKLYLGDREGSKVWRCDMDGKNLEVLISGHDIQQVVGVAPDPIKKHFYFSDRNGKKLFRANMEMPMGQTHADRKDVELLYVDKAANAMPLDIELDVTDRKIYWTDRQQNKVFTMSMDMPAGMDATSRTDVKAVQSGLIDVIGLGFDHEAKVLYATHSGSVSSFKADGSDMPKSVGTNGVTGIAFTKIK
jgi:DNA-binding beta-propeller fold protein YncE